MAKIRSTIKTSMEQMESSVLCFLEVSRSL